MNNATNKTNEEAADLLEKHLDFFAGTTQWVFTLAIAALRSTPPATGAAAMREAIALLRNASQQSHTAHFDKTGGSGSGCPECIRARDLREKADAILRALPAPEVPSEVREWVRIHMGTSNGDSLHDRLERFVRDWIRKEYGL